MRPALRLHVCIIFSALSLSGSGCQLQQLAPALLGHWNGALDKKANTDASAAQPRTDLTSVKQQDSPIDPVEQKNGLLLAQASLMEADGDTHQAINAYQNILEGDRKNLHAMRRLAVLHASRGDLETAEQTFQNALAIDPRNAQVQSDYGYFCYLQRRWNLAEEHLLQALECDPALRQARFNLGLLHARRGDSQAALRDFQDAGCTVSDSYNNVAVARLLEDDYDAAREALNAAIQIDPDNHDSARGIALLDRIRSGSSGDRPRGAIR